MAITKYDISNRSISDLANKLSMFAGASIGSGIFFKSVSLSGSTITCTDWDDNTILTIKQNGTYAWSYSGGNSNTTNAFRTATTINSSVPTPLSSAPLAVYKVGDVAACIDLEYGTENNHIGMVVIGRASNNKTAIMFPLLQMVNANNPPEFYSVYSSGMEITGSNGDTVTSYTVKQSVWYSKNIAGFEQKAELQAIGSYGENITVNNVFILRAVQENIYGNVNIVSGLGMPGSSYNEYLTNGLVAIRDVVDS